MTEALNERTLEALARGIRRGGRARMEDRLVKPYEAWGEIMGAEFVPLGRAGEKQVLDGLRLLLDEVPEHDIESFLSWAKRRMFDEGLTIRSPHSLAWLVPYFRLVQNGLGAGGGDGFDDRGRYLNQSFLGGDDE